ncbi:MAG: gfo/Idh/MocA family oxidoreductase, partial [Acidobacteriota bacterium]|nr:gfo/Idh/MocA family oxidoreductase [Acidobacteriota bacterium]
PEAFLDAFANVYRNAVDTMRARLAHVRPDSLVLDFPTVDDGLRGMLFLETLVKSAKSNRKWTRVPVR